MSLRDEPKIQDLIAARERADAINRLAFPDLLDGLGSDFPVPDPPPSLEAIEGWLKQHREMQTSNVRVHILDAAVENVEEARRK